MKDFARMVETAPPQTLTATALMSGREADVKLVTNSHPLLCIYYTILHVCH